MSLEAIGLTLEGYNEKIAVTWEQARVQAFYLSGQKSYQAFCTVSFPLPGDKKKVKESKKPDIKTTQRYIDILKQIDGKKE